MTDLTYLTLATSFDNDEVRAVFLSSSPTRLSQWHPNYGAWVQAKPDSLRVFMQMDEAMQRVSPGRNRLIHRVDKSTAMAAARAMKPYPGPVVSGELLKTMIEGVLMGKSFESLGIANTTLNWVRFDALGDDYHCLPEGEEWIIQDPGGDLLVYGGDWS